MKFNWGTGIFIFYTIFALTLVFVVYQSTTHDNSLVVEDYYAKDIAYQSTYNKKQNSLSLSEPVHIAYNKVEEQVTIQFPVHLKPKGNIFFYKPDNKKLDTSFPIVINEEGLMSIPVSKMVTGAWQVQADWEANGKSYLDVKDIQKR